MENRQFDFLDILSIISFAVSLQSLEIANMNLIENREQTNDTHKILSDLQEHLNQQDEILAKQDKILLKLNGGDK